MTRAVGRAVLLLLVATAVGVGGAGSQARAADKATAPGAADRVVVLAVPGLTWADIGAETPTLLAAVPEAAVGSLSVRSGQRVTRPVGGFLTISSGSRAVAPDPQAGPAQVLSDLAGVQAANLAGAYRSRIGLLGATVRAAGLPTAALGPGAVLAAMDEQGRVTATPAEPAAAPDRGLLVVSRPDLPGQPPAPRSAGTRARTMSPERAAALRAADRAFAGLRASAGPRDALLVLGSSESVTGPAHLHVALALGAGNTAGVLSAPSTGRLPYVQLIDVAPTVLALLGSPVPNAMIGAAWRTVPGAVDVASLRDQDVAARAQARWSYRMLLVLVLGGVLLAAAVAGRVLAGSPVLLPRSLRAAAVLLAALPVSVTVAMLTPWHRTPLALPLLVALLAGLVAAGTRVVTGSWSRAGLAVVVLTGGVLAADLAAGGALQLDSPLGDSPLIAGRFHGAGNTAFALFGTAALVTAALLSRSGGRRGLLLAAGACGAAVILDGAPPFGSDLGGVVALVPAAGVLVLQVSGRRVGPARGALLLTLAGVVASVLAVLDHLRPAAAQTHLGRFVGQVLDGEAAAVLRRRLGAAAGSVTASWYVWLLLAFLVVTVLFLVRRPPTADPVVAGVLRTAAPAVGVLLVLGGVLNDSGIAVPGAAVALVGPVALVAFAGPRRGTDPP